MYSRKFNGINPLPPDYSGVSMRQEVNTPPPPPPTRENEDTYPRYPVYENTHYDECRQNDNAHNDIKKESSAVRDHGNPKSLLKKSFSLEDMVLAGLILLLMNEEDRDDGLLLILGFLLLIGMKS